MLQDLACNSGHLFALDVMELDRFHMATGLDEDCSAPVGLTVTSVLPFSVGDGSGFRLRGGVDIDMISSDEENVIGNPDIDVNDNAVPQQAVPVAVTSDGSDAGSDISIHASADGPHEFEALESSDHVLDWFLNPHRLTRFVTSGL